MKPINPKPLIQDDFEEAIKQAILQVKQSKWLKKTIETLKIKESEIQQHLSTFLKLEIDEQEVEQCRLAGKCLKPQGHYVVSIQRNAVGFLERKFSPCPMLDDQLKVSRFLIYDDFNPDWKDSKLFESLKQREGQKALYVYLMKVLQKQTNDGLALIGPHQSGKSFALGIFAFRYALNELGTIGMLDFNLQLPRLIANKKMDANGFNGDLAHLLLLGFLRHLRLCLRLNLLYQKHCVRLGRQFAQSVDDALHFMQFKVERDRGVVHYQGTPVADTGFFCALIWAARLDSTSALSI